MSDLVVFDTNVFVSYLLPTKKITAVHLAVERIFDGKAIPVYSDAIMEEYNRVLHYKRLKFPLPRVCSFLQSIIDNGYFVNPTPTDVLFIDISDKPFYDAARAAGAWLVTASLVRLTLVNRGKLVSIPECGQHKTLPTGGLHHEPAGVPGAHRRLAAARGVDGGRGGRYSGGGIQEGNMFLDEATENEAFDVEDELRLIEAMPPVSAAEALRAVEAIRQAVKSRGLPEMTMEEIDAEIAQCRRERRQRQEKHDDLEKVCKLDVQDAFVYQYS